MRITRIYEFDVNEGILSSIFSGIGNALSSKKSKLLNLLKEIKKAKDEEIDTEIEIERSIANTSKLDTEESRFILSNLHKQQKTHSSLKTQEINGLVKSASKIINNDPKLHTFFSSQLALIETKGIEKLLDQLKKYKSETDLTYLRKDLEYFSKEAKKEVPGEKQDTRITQTDLENDIVNVSPELIEFVDCSNVESSKILNQLSQRDVERYYSELRNWLFTLEIKYDSAIEKSKKDQKNARKEGQDWLIPNLEKEELRIRYYMKKPIDRIKYKINLIEKEIKLKKYVNN
jgi:hypothetical protein